MMNFWESFIETGDKKENVRIELEIRYEENKFLGVELFCN